VRLIVFGVALVRGAGTRSPEYPRHRIADCYLSAQYTALLSIGHSRSGSAR